MRFSVRFQRALGEFIIRDILQTLLGDVASRSAVAVFLCFYGGRIHVFFCIKKQVLASYKITMKILGLTFWLHCLLLTGCSCLSLNVSYKCINY